MGVLNVTPDSFSDGGRWLDSESAIARGRQLVEAGADIVDVGGESTRPGAHAVAVEEELRRVLPVVEALAAEMTVSIDTRKEAVARAAIAAGATIINDVSASLWDVAADTGAGWVAMHMPADPVVMQEHAVYEDVVSEVLTFLEDRANKARAAGVEQIWIDPGIGFGKTARHNLQLLRDVDRFVGSGWPVLIGTSRKSFLGALTPGPDGVPAPAEDRLEASVATSVWAISRGVDMVRVHDVGPVAQAAVLAGEPSDVDRGVS
jgi:dihydropteroate synthase